MAVIINQIIILGLLMLVGNIASRKGVINKETGKGLGAILTNVAMPAMVLKAFMIEFEPSMTGNIINVLIYSTLIHLGTWLFMFPILKKLPKETRNVYGFGIVFANTIFMALPLISEMYGELGFLYGSIYTLPFQLLFWTLGVYMVSEDKKEVELKKIIKSPSIIAIVVGGIMFSTGVRFPDPIERTILLIAGMTTPISMFILGEKSTSIDFKKALIDKNNVFALFVKLILVPLITLVVFTFIIKIEDTMLRNIYILMQAMPPASIVIVLAENYKKSPEKASEFIILAHGLSLVTIPIIMFFISMLPA